jgi:hypothetical protein
MISENQLNQQLCAKTAQNKVNVAPYGSSKIQAGP